MKLQHRRCGSATGILTWGPIIATTLLLAAVAPASAQSGGSESTGRQSSGWTYELTPYLWGSGLDGTTRGGNLPTTSIDWDFTDIADILDFGAMGTFEARKGRWGLSLDLLYLSLSDSGTASRTGSGPVGATLTADADVEVKQTMLAAAGMYRMIDTRTPVDVFGGLRYTNIDVEADIDASLFGPLEAGAARRVSRGREKDWIDPYFGVRIQHAVTDRWTVVGYADVGGFGAGSDLTWQAIVGASYENSKRYSFKFGYRYMRIDYDKDGFLYDVTMRGPYAGVGIRF